MGKQLQIVNIRKSKTRAFKSDELITFSIIVFYSKENVVLEGDVCMVNVVIISWTYF